MRGSEIYADLWGTAEVRGLFDDRSRIQSWLDILSALALAQADEGLIPADSAREIEASSNVALLDLDYVAAETRSTAHSTLGLIRAMQRVLSPEAGEWLCYGATVQDLTDTWTVLVIRTMGGIVYRDLRAIEAALVELARTYRSTPMAARTHGQSGLPITFGFKTAVWASEARRHIERLGDGRPRWLVSQLGGAAGSGSFWGDMAIPLLERFSARIGLGAPDIAWLSARDRMVEFASVLAMVVHTLGKIGNEILQLQRSEIEEIEEPFVPGVVGSITMPHKRNPERAEHLVTLSRLARSDFDVLLEGMVVEHERDGRSWKAEWAAFPDLCLLSGAALATARTLVQNLVVRPERMRANLESQGGYVLSERVMGALAQSMGKQSAHRAVYEASMSGIDRGVSFREALGSADEIVTRLGPDLIDELLDLEGALGSCEAFVDRVLERAAAARSSEEATWP